MDHQILMIFAQMMGIGEKLKLTLGQGHKVKGQGHICVALAPSLYIMTKKLEVAK